MAKDNILTRVVAWAILICVVMGFVVAYVHLNGKYTQAQRELEYIKAHQRVAAEKYQRALEYERRLQQDRLRRQYNQGSVAGQAASNIL